MTTDAKNDFAAGLRDDEEMAKGLAASLGEKNDAEGVAALVAYSRERGLNVTAEDVETLRRSAARQDALTDDELDAVSGAGLFDFVGQAFASLFTPDPAAPDTRQLSHRWVG